MSRFYPARLYRNPLFFLVGISFIVERALGTAIKRFNRFLNVSKMTILTNKKRSFRSKNCPFPHTTVRIDPDT